MFCLFFCGQGGVWVFPSFLFYLGLYFDQGQSRGHTNGLSDFCSPCKSIYLCLTLYINCCSWLWGPGISGKFCGKLRFSPPIPICPVPPMVLFRPSPPPINWGGGGQLMRTFSGISWPGSPRPTVCLRWLRYVPSMLGLMSSVSLSMSSLWSEVWNRKKDISSKNRHFWTVQVTLWVTYGSIWLELMQVAIYKQGWKHMMNVFALNWRVVSRLLIPFLLNIFFSCSSYCKTWLSHCLSFSFV